MRALAVALLLSTGCLQQGPDVFEGVESDAACSWDRWHPERGQCVSNGRRLRCIRGTQQDAWHWWKRVSCSPYRIWK